ncbi:MAG TPA: hypothetical protein DDZ51_24905 [Planctomycetaceae bacterium]|nr:hypothetical protein [Planctomycetaceae bacterium]
MNDRSSRFDFRRQRRSDAALRLACAVTLALILLGLSGCRGKAYRDVYQQKMIGEIRNLEDQLYEADYQNRILVDELARSRSRVVVPDAKQSRPLAQPRTQPRRESPFRDLGGPGDDSALTPVPLEPEQRQPTLPARPIPDPSPADLTPPPISRPQPNRDQNFVPPMVPIPPGADIEMPDVDLGEPVPPSGINAVPELPAGQIKLPDSTRRSVRVEPKVPVAIRVNPSTSGGYRFDDAKEKTGMQLTIEAIDEAGNLVRLEDFNIVGQLSVVLLDPQRSADDARLGRWDYDADELRQMIRSGPNSAIHVYLAWEDKLPTGKLVIAHVKLSHDDLQMQAQADLKTAEIEVAQWNPRGVQMK